MPRKLLLRFVTYFFVLGMELMKVRAGILRAVGKEIGTAWQEVCGCLDLDITMEDEIEMEDKIGKFSVLS